MYIKHANAAPGYLQNCVSEGLNPVSNHILLCQNKETFTLQGNQIGRIFAHGHCLLCASCFKLQKFFRNFRATFFPQLRLCINFYNSVFGYILGDLFHKLIWSPLPLIALRGAASKHCCQKHFVISKCTQSNNEFVYWSLG
jgi:hypothetical protein